MAPDPRPQARTLPRVRREPPLALAMLMRSHIRGAAVMAAAKPKRVCVQGDGSRGYCGRSANPIAPRAKATCADCQAAIRADELHERKRKR